MNITKNTGLLIGEPAETYLFGSTSKIVHEARNTTQDWEQFRSRNERQNQNPSADRMHCVSASGTNDWEEQANMFLTNNLWPQESLDFWNGKNSLGVSFIVNGKFEISRRFTAKMSETTREGNYFYKVWDSIRPHENGTGDGVIPDSLWADDPSYGWDEYYKEIPPELIALGKESLKHFKLLYESMSGAKTAEMRNSLEMAPLHFGVTTACGWDSEVPVCNAPANHAIVCDEIRPDDSYEIFDSYDPYTKHLRKGYIVSICYRAVLYPVKPVLPSIPSSPNALNQDIKFGESGLEVLKLRQALNSNGWQNDTSNISYNIELSKVVKNWQLANLLPAWLSPSFKSVFAMLISLDGKSFGPKSREVINKLIK